MSHALMTIGAAASAMGFTQPTTSVDTYPYTGVRAADASFPVTAGASSSPAVATEPNGPVATANHFLYDFYYRIWVIPTTLIAQNPQYDTPIPFFIWNAYPQPIDNLLEGISFLDGDGLEIDGAADLTFRAIEYRQMGVIITPDAPGSVDATITFDFAVGTGVLRFIASIANILALQFEDGIHVDYEWLTDVLQRYNGDEQRLALRERPRRTFSANIILGDDAERKALYDQLYKTATSLLTIPLYQHQTPLRAATVIGDNKIYCNPKRADLRVGGYVLMLKRNGAQILSKVATVAADHVTVETAHSEAVPVNGTKVMSAVTTRLPDMSGLSMASKGGVAALTLMEYAAQDTLEHPLSTTTLATHYGAVVLERRPLADKGDERFSTGLTTIDNETGRPARFTGWSQKYVQGERAYLINTLFSPADLDYWMAFLDYCRGQQKTFLASTWREDLVPTGAGLLVTSVEVAGLEYAQLYSDTETYRNIEIETEAHGTFWLQIESYTTDTASTTLTFTDPIVVDLTGVVVTRISYLIKSRLGSDKIGIDFADTFAVINLALKAV